MMAGMENSFASGNEEAAGADEIAGTSVFRRSLDLRRKKLQQQQ